MAIFGQKPWVNPFAKCQFFDFFKLVVFIGYKVFFLSLEYHKRQFPSLYCRKKKVEKMANFGPKPSVNGFGKMSFFRLF